MNEDRKRFELLLETIEQMAGGDLGARFPISDARDDLDAIGYGLNVLVEELKETITSLERANEELSNFVYVASHDLKTPLRGIRNCARFLEEDLGGRLTEKEQCHLTSLKRCANRGQAQIDDLLAYSLLDNAPAATVEIGPLLEAVRRDHADEHPEATLTLVNEVSTFETNATLFRQIVDNLVSNGLKFNSGPHPAVEIVCEPFRSGIAVRVADDGIGIEPRHFERIFELFERLHDQREFEGTGIGLAIASKAARVLRGRLRVHSNVGGGSTFILELPRRRDTIVPSGD